MNTLFNSSGEINFDDFMQSPYLDAVISETMRKYSPAYRTERECKQDYELGDTGIKILKGQFVEIPIYAIHHSDEYYENPEQYIPERFLPENRHKLIPYTYLPFGGGPRNCIGMRFVLMEAKLVLAHLVNNFVFVRSANTDIPIKFKRLTLGLISERVILSVVKR